MNKRFLIFAAVIVLLGLVCVLLLLNPNAKQLFAFGKKSESVVPVSGTPLVLPETEAQTETQTEAQVIPQNNVTETESVSEPAQTVAAEASEPYVSPIDFAALQKKNPDIYAWISVEGTDISYPVVQSADDSYYLDHDENGESSPEGTIYSESTYNGKTFEDSITVLYGHHMKSGRMFGNLQQMFSDPEQFEKCRDIVIYTPEKELRYRVFAAVPYDNRHIPYNYGLKGDVGMLSFLHSLSSVRSLDAVTDDEDFAVSGDRLLVLSTCLKGDRTRRFLVVAKMVQPE